VIEGGGDNGARGHNPSLWRDTAIDVHRLLVPPVLTLHRWVGARDRVGSEILDDVGRSKLLMGRAVEEGDPMTQDELQSALTGSAGSGALTRHGLTRRIFITEGIVFLVEQAPAHWLTISSWRTRPILGYAWSLPSMDVGCRVRAASILCMRPCFAG
jgi:hypothetical protein